MGRDPGTEDPEQKFRNVATGSVITGNRTANCEIQVGSCGLPVPENWVATCSSKDPSMFWNRICMEFLQTVTLHVVYI